MSLMNYFNKIIIRVKLQEKEIKESLKYKIKELEERIDRLQNEKAVLAVEIEDLKKDNKDLKKAVGNLEIKITNLENENKCFEKSLNQLLNDNYSKGQEIIQKNDNLKKIKERDNYKAIIYDLDICRWLIRRNT